MRLARRLGRAYHSRRAPGLRAKAGLVEAIHQFRQPLAQAMRQVGISGPDRDVQLAFPLDHPKFYALSIGLPQLHRKVFQRRRRLGGAFFGA
jgi:hypothetical protein